MSDFIFSTQKIETGVLKRELQDIYLDKKVNVWEFRGSWGSLGFSENLYNGFNHYETSQHISIILGGPVLNFCNNSFIGQNNSNKGTKAIYERWLNNKINWERDISGPFCALFIDKITAEITFITDLMSFIPIYIYENKDSFSISTHVDALANVTNTRCDIDHVSLADFILTGITTYPYTLYNKIHQVHPGAIHTIKNNRYSKKIYWLPYEDYRYSTINKAAKDIQKSIENYINIIKKFTKSSAQFISGGEDSRIISYLLDPIKRDGFIFLDAENRESRVAKKVARHHNVSLNLKIRNSHHYLNYLERSSKLVGSGSQYMHVHTIGFDQTCKLEQYDAVFGGLFADALLKGSRIEKLNFQNRLAFLPQIKKKHSIGYILKNLDLFSEDIQKEIVKRKEAHINYIKEFRKNSYHEWGLLWPSSMNRSIPNLHGNRRLFRSFEPFMCHEIVKISASVHQKWKLNRRLFLKSMKPYFQKTKFIPHSDGRFPAFNWKVNLLPHFLTWFYFQIGRKIGLFKHSQDSWADWRKLSKSKLFIEKLHLFQKKTIIKDDELEKKLRSKSTKLNPVQKLTYLQILYLTSRD